MGIRIDGASDLINATDGSLTIEGQSINSTGIGTFSGGVKVGSAATIHSTGQFNIGVAATIFTNGNATFAGIVTAASFSGAVDLTGSTNNTVVTVTGSNAIQGEANLTYDGNSLSQAIDANDEGINITGSGAHAARLKVDTNQSSADDTIFFQSARWNSTEVASIHFRAGTDTTNKDDGRITFHTTTSGSSIAERLRIREDGRISIASSLAVAGVCTAASFIPSMGQLSHRNLIINGDMAINQYGSSSTSSGIKHIDRWAMYAEGANTTLTQSKSDVASGTAPYQLGFRSAFKILNAGQSNSNVGGDTIRIEQHIEDQMIARSGWDYKSSSSYLTLSFWVKSSVAQDFVITLMNRSDLGTGDIKTYSQNFTIGSADTWTKITTKIPGSSSLTLDNDTTRGLTLAFYMYMGGDDTDGSHTDGAWQAYNGADLAKQQTITWWTTSNSTVEYTGVQLEVGEYATPFEHCGYDRELLRCQRYYH